jgi:hypothetical protein
VSSLKYGRPPPSPGVTAAFRGGAGKLANQHRRTISGGTAASTDLLSKLLNKVWYMLSGALVVAGF